jgi:hypothetical protein
VTTRADCLEQRRADTSPAMVRVDRDLLQVPMSVEFDDGGEPDRRIARDPSARTYGDIDGELSAGRPLWVWRSVLVLSSISSHVIEAGTSGHPPTCCPGVPSPGSAR